MSGLWDAPDGEPGGTGTSGLDEDLQGAGFAVRAGARIIDMVAAMVAGWFGGIAVSVVFVVLSALGVVSAGFVSRLGGQFWVSFGLGLIAAVIAPAASEWIGGVTLGKWVLGLRVVSLDGGRISLGQGLLRGVAYYVDSFFFALPAYTSMQDNALCQRYGDKWAGTAVLYRESTPERARADLAWLVAAVVVGLGVRVGMSALALAVGAAIG